MILKRKQTTSYIWKTLEDLFLDKKDAKVIEFDNELHNIVMDYSFATKYCSHIKTIIGLLDNIETTVPEKNIATYLINGLSPKFDLVAIMIRHKTPLPSFLKTKLIILFEEQRMEHNNCRSGLSSRNDHASSPTILNVSRWSH
ncbi:uncharacterized protein LOC111903906 [Lactuca sativa]|uniref:uncharacterized protein LOC111903906 n=1 Tax=Lactuca sativa TaxID=4236 RepID=UPI000CD94746|nr:uncharacterized protein LOC111903906 [Lactuca sativa]